MPTPPPHGPQQEVHLLSLATPYGEVIETEEVAAPELPAALRRFHDHAISRANSVVVLDGIVHTRNAFLEFVRAYNDCAARTAHLH